MDGVGFFGGDQNGVCYLYIQANCMMEEAIIVFCAKDLMAGISISNDGKI